MRRHILLLLVAISQPMLAQVVQVRHDHDPWGACEGKLIVNDEGIQYVTEEEDHQRTWGWVDIQGFDRRSAEAFSILTYEDLKWHAGLDRNFDFTVLPGEAGLPSAAFERILMNVIRPVTDRVPSSIDAEYSVPVKHLHVFGGCEGRLSFGSEWIVYETDHAEHARRWKRNQHIVNVWSSNPFELEIRVLEEDRRAFDKVKRFTFQLKESLDPAYYERLRREFLLPR